jgi:hypothetical protein
MLTPPGKILAGMGGRQQAIDYAADLHSCFRKARCGDPDRLAA